ncbi:hypothetical protein G6F31_017031 [Rhizopus arrhizus]|nr:hypothetical protein G6F31_017031 [Rhizopus arrhizus]
MPPAGQISANNPSPAARPSWLCWSVAKGRRPPKNWVRAWAWVRRPGPKRCRAGSAPWSAMASWCRTGAVASPRSRP